MKIKKNILHLIKHRYGYDIVPCIKPADYRTQKIEPLKAFIYNHKKPILVNVKPCECTNFMGVNFSIKDNIISQLLKKTFINDMSGTSIEKTLERGLQSYNSYFRHYKTASDILQLSENSNFSNLPVLGFVLPWENKNPEEALAKRLTILEKESNNVNENLNIEPDDSYRDILDKRIPANIIRYKRLYKSISKNGYVRSNFPDGDINVAIMVGENKASYHILSGNHRIAMLSALGYETITVRIVDVIYREEAYYWPQVLREKYKYDEAVNYFDKMNNGITHNVLEMVN